jgi:hypothetical protein
MNLDQLGSSVVRIVGALMFWAVCVYVAKLVWYW